MTADVHPPNVDQQMLLAAWPILKPALSGGELWHMHVYHDAGCRQRPCDCRPEIEIRRDGDPRPLYRLALVGDQLSVEINDLAIQ